MELPPDVVPLEGGGLEVRAGRGWRGMAIVIGVGGFLLGIGLLGAGLGLRALDVDAGPLPLVGVLFMVFTPFLASVELRGQRAETWVLDRQGLRVGGRAAAWPEVASVRLRDRHTRLPRGLGSGVGPWVRLVSVSVHDRDGAVLLSLPDENHDHRLRTVFALAHARGLVPPHVRFDEAVEGSRGGP